MPFGGHLVFRQYLPNKPSKYGIKLYKLCDSICYTFRIIIYSGKDTYLSPQKDFPAAGKLIIINIKLMDGYLDKGRTVIVDNYYTSTQFT